MAEWGFSPSVRLFEAAACACPIISDTWPGLDSILKTGEEVLVAESSSEIIFILRDTDDLQLQRIGQLARERVLVEHSSSRRAEEFEQHVSSVSAGKSRLPSQILLAASTSAAFPGGSAQPIS